MLGVLSQQQVVPTAFARGAHSMAHPHKKVPVQTAVDLTLSHYIAVEAISVSFAPYQNIFVGIGG